MRKLITIFVLLAFLMVMLSPAIVAAPPGTGGNSTQGSDPGDPTFPDDPWGGTLKAAPQTQPDDDKTSGPGVDSVEKLWIVVKVWSIRFVMGVL
ncbi:MAG: hypothetical protein JSU69_10190 [Candidatus Zixiibacteriota bacterium]|nr:MAG: hypothetical protein JSU69_10190 [candidate division Zixibacteria bacterium]